MLRLQVGLLGAALTPGLIGAAEPTQPPVTPDRGYTTSPFLSKGRSYDVLFRGDRYRLGRFDPDGNFVPEAGHPPLASGMFHGIIPHIHANRASRDNRAVYEHRSGRLIKGTLLANPMGVFVPETGSTILDLKADYDLKKAERRVYNLQETLRISPVAPDPPKGGVPAGWGLVSFREAFPQSPEKVWFARVIGEVMELGHLSDEGEFVPDYGLPVFPFVRVKGSDIIRDATGRTMYYTLPLPLSRRRLSHRGETEDDPEAVFEYRSGRLIKGMLHKTGNFAPELGSKVLDFKEYDPMRDRRIYNLPGVLRRVE